MNTNSTRLVQIAQTLYETFARRDIPAILDLLDPEVVWCEPPNPFNPASGSRVGHAGFLEWAKTGNEAEEILALEIKQFLSGPETVAVVGFVRCLARATGRTYQTDFVHVIGFRDDKIVRFQEYFDTFAAAEAFKP